MTASASAVVPLEVLARRGDLELRARLAVEGYLVGRHRSLRRGYGGEFVQYRPYVPGDDARYVDWKLFARQERLCMKSFNEETDMRVALVVDASASMAYCGKNAPCSKLHYAVMAAACLAYLARRQGDQTGLFVYGGEDGAWSNRSGGEWSLARLLGTLSMVKPGGDSHLESVLPQVEDFVVGHGVTVILSDFHNEEQGLESRLKHLRHGRSDVMAIQILDDDELKLPFGDGVRFVDAEDGKEVDASSDIIRAEYRESFDAFCKAVREASLNSQGDYLRIMTSSELGEVLSAFLAMRR